MSNQSLREAAQQALECKRLADNYAGACGGCDPGEFATKERDELHVGIDKLAALAQPDDKAQPVAPAVLGEVIGCFEAAFTEGLQEALAETKDERLKDLIERRLMHALYAAQNAAPQPPAEQAAELSNGDIDVIIHKCVGSPIGMHIWRSFARAVIAEDRAARGGAA